MDPTFVMLKGSGAIALEGLQLAWRLEDQGLQLHLSPHGRLVVDCPPGVDDIRGVDLVAVATHEAALTALCRYIEREGWKTDAD